MNGKQRQAMEERSGMTQVYLVPGIFGFTELGSFNYFNRVSEVLGQALEEHNVDAEIIEVDTVPTGSIRRRAIRLIEVVGSHNGLKQDKLHFVGHSAGGLDVRMLLTPGVRLLGTKEEIQIAERTRSAITLSTPHYGTPLANFFMSLNGRYLLYLLTLLATSGPGRYSVYVAARFLAAIARLDHLIGQRENILDAVARNVLSKLRPERGDAFWEFTRKISEDQGAMLQLTPECMDLFNAAVPDRENVDYVCFASASPSPDLRSFVLRPRNLYASVTHAVYAASYTVASTGHGQYPYPVPNDKVLNEMHEDLSLPVHPGSNDGIVPLFSQIWGRFAGGVVGDHLDVVGQFEHMSEGQVYTAWLVSGSEFDEQRFRKLWSEIAAVIASNE